MPPTPEPSTFTLADLDHAARRLLEASPEPVVACRLLREVLRVPPSDPELAQLKEAAAASKWVRQLVDSQLPDGSWGRFHSQDTTKKTAFRTTEEAIDRAFAIGLEPDDGVLTRASTYIQDVLTGNARITDRAEKSEAWPLLIRFILAGRLAQIDPKNDQLDPSWAYLAEVAEHALASGEYCLRDEVNAYLNLSGIHVPTGFLESQHALWILSSRTLPRQLERALVDWIRCKPDGIRYIRISLTEPRPRQIGYWLKSMNILSRFGSWQELFADTLNRVWEQRDADGLWDFSSNIARSVNFPLSSTWRQSTRRMQDYSTCILALLRRYFD